MIQEGKAASMAALTKMQTGRTTCALLLCVLALAGVGVHAEAPRPSAADVRGAYDDGMVFVDVRTDSEWSGGHVKDAVHLPLDQIAARAASLLPAKDATLVLYCHTGRRAQSAAEQLRQLGYTHVSAMTGGYDDLKAAGFPVVE